VLFFVVFSFRMAVEAGEEALRREQRGIQELQQQLDQERALSLRKDREDEERREVRRGLSTCTGKLNVL